MRILNPALWALCLVWLATPAFAAKAKYEEGEVSGGGAIEGSVVYHGPVKKRTILPTKDKKVCGGIRKEPLIVVGDGGAVKDSVVFLKDVASGKPWPEMSGGGRPVLDQKDCRFKPHVQVARRGRIDIVNSDPVLHNTHGYYGKRTAFNVALPIQGGKVTKLLKSPGEVRDRLRRSRLDARLDLRGRQSILRADRRRRQVLDHRRAARASTRWPSGRRSWGWHGNAGQGRGQPESRRAPVELQAK